MGVYKQGTERLYRPEERFLFNKDWVKIKYLLIWFKVSTFVRNKFNFNVNRISNVCRSSG